MRVFLFKPLFFITFVVTITFLYVTSGGETVGFSFFKVWTIHQNVKIGNEFIKVSAIESPVVSVVLSQLDAGKGAQFVYTDDVFGNGLKVYDSIETLVGVDILQLFENQSDKQKVLDAHISQLEHSLESIRHSQQQLQQLIAESRSTSNECLVQKRVGDQRFFEGVHRSQGGELQEGLEQSAEFSQCYIENRIYANAYSYMLSRVGAYTTLAANRKKILETHEQTIIHSYPLLQGNVLQELLGVQRSLQSVKAIGFGDVSGFFRFSVPTAEEQVPEFYNFRFRDNGLQSPTFLDPVKPLQVR